MNPLAGAWHIVSSICSSYSMYHCEACSGTRGVSSGRTEAAEAAVSEIAL